MNDRIRAREVRVIDENGEQLGVLPPSEALAIARERELDLIEVAPNAQPPVCRIIDYGKWKYEQGKREKEQARRQKQSELKGAQLEPRIDDHDLQIKTKNILRFLREGDKVKITVKFKWRELAHPEFATAHLKKITDAMLAEGVGQIERPAVLEGRQMIMVLSPIKDAVKKVEPVKKEKPERTEQEKAERAEKAKEAEARGRAAAAEAAASSSEPKAEAKSEPKAEDVVEAKEAVVEAKEIVAETKAEVVTTPTESEAKPTEETSA
jgi:translation initiation factor IF-3